MSTKAKPKRTTPKRTSDQRQELIITVFEEAFAELMAADPVGFRTKYRKMAGDPFAFYRGSACLFYADMLDFKDPWADDKTSRVWIHGDLHAENFGTYMNSHGVLVFDVNDFDEAYLGNFSWDLRRFVASLALMGWQKALPEEALRYLGRVYLQAYVSQVQQYVEGPADEDFALRLDTTEGVVHRVLQDARTSTRIGMLDSLSSVKDYDRQFTEGSGVRRLKKAEEHDVYDAFLRYRETIPESKREHHDTFYVVKDVVGKAGFGVGSAGLPAYNVLIEGFNQALENDVVLSMKQGNVPALSRIVDVAKARNYFEHEGHRTTVSQRALQVHADPFLGYTTVDGVGYVVDEMSPYESDLDWTTITEPEDIEPVLVDLGRATAKVHCVSDEDSDQGLVEFQTEEVIAAAVGSDPSDFVTEIVDWSIEYAHTARADYALFVDAFREGRIGGVSAT
ncbi:MAG: DUF2252 domain-containing protein [Actinomycetota bacterium]|nr:DUF2252 domain-containing protein [Actinomycetota bacterium]